MPLRNTLVLRYCSYRPLRLNKASQTRQLEPLDRRSLPFGDVVQFGQVILKSGRKLQDQTPSEPTTVNGRYRANKKGSSKRQEASCVVDNEGCVVTSTGMTLQCPTRRSSPCRCYLTVVSHACKLFSAFSLRPSILSSPRGLAV